MILALGPPNKMANCRFVHTYGAERSAAPPVGGREMNIGRCQEQERLGAAHDAPDVREMCGLSIGFA